MLCIMQVVYIMQGVSAGFHSTEAKLNTKRGRMPKNACCNSISWKDRTFFLGQLWSTDQLSLGRNEDLFVSMTCVKQRPLL